MNSNEIRNKFLEFFKKKGHIVVPSSSLIPDDPSVLLTTAGMQQFKRYFTGELNPIKDFGSQRTVSIQKSFRTTDIEKVGDESHLTFFEMLGNFSFGPVGSNKPEDFSTAGYFKRPAINWAYEFITEELKIPKEKIEIAVFGGDPTVPFDDKSYNIWQEIGIPKEKIKKGGREDNFWGPTGDEGPCGPTTEIYIDGLEIWNIVFNEYYQEKIPNSKFQIPNSRLKKLESPGVDTGMGLERLAAAVQGVKDIFETDVFQRLIKLIKELIPDLDEKISRIFADHLRAISFLIADGVEPSNKEAGYILRRLLRRLIAYQIKNNISANPFPKIIEFISEQFKLYYPKISDTQKIIKVVENEKNRFQKTIRRGLNEIQKLKEITGQEAFYLYETFGLPLELIFEFADKKAVKFLNREDFEKEFEKHREISRSGAVQKFGGHGLVSKTTADSKIIRLHTATHLLHQALRDILGEEVRQMGSDINSERTRFDFSFNRKLTHKELGNIEAIVNQKIKEDLPVTWVELPIEEAKKTGALHFFKEKYPERVKVYSIGSPVKPYSREFCAGPHIEGTSQIGKFKILKEEAIAMGIRRIRAVVE